MKNNGKILRSFFAFSFLFFAIFISIISTSAAKSLKTKIDMLYQKEMIMDTVTQTKIVTSGFLNKYYGFKTSSSKPNILYPGLLENNYKGSKKIKVNDVLTKKKDSNLCIVERDGIKNEYLFRMPGRTQDFITKLERFIMIKLVLIFIIANFLPSKWFNLNK